MSSDKTRRGGLQAAFFCMAWPLFSNGAKIGKSPVPTMKMTDLVPVCFILNGYAMTMLFWKALN